MEIPQDGYPDTSLWIVANAAVYAFPKGYNQDRCLTSCSIQRTQILDKALK